MKHLAVGAFAMLSVAALAQAPSAMPGDDLALADKALECASVQAQQVLFLEAAKLDVGPGYKYVGYWYRVGAAFSSKAYADEKYLALRTELAAKVDETLPFEGAEFLERARTVVAELQAKERECGAFHHEHGLRIKKRLEKFPASRLE